MAAVLNWFGWGSEQPVTTVRITGSGFSSDEWEMVGDTRAKGGAASPRDYSSSGSTFIPAGGGTVVHELGDGRALEVRVVESPSPAAASPVFAFRGEPQPVNGHGRTLLRVAAAVTFVFAVTLLAFFIAYSQGAFHFESFIGPIGYNVSLSLTATLAALSATVLLCSYR
ncbi:MAG: hypothetical protein S4CHLAM2_13840 [Chlamydiales bacterium]|nr:hypothetical protein [Chlamydiales bacterium]